MKIRYGTVQQSIIRFGLVIFYLELFDNTNLSNHMSDNAMVSFYQAETSNTKIA